ncbi:hypothetical protein BJ138DRAFT_1011307, partial [Hygrophoropsis aurantiaca]
MIARCRAKSWIIQLKEEDNQCTVPNAQRGMKGHVIIYPQEPSRIASMLPPTMEDIVTPICVIFIGSSPPTAEWLKAKARPLIVRKERVRDALKWLKANNLHYKDITINHDMLDDLDDEQLLPVHIEHVCSSEADDVLTSRYDSADVNLSSNEEPPIAINFQNVVVTDVDGNAPSHQLRAAALRHVRKQGTGYIEVPHGAAAVNEFNNPALFPMIYPTLYPYGLGGFEDSARSAKLSLKRHVKHL